MVYTLTLNPSMDYVVRLDGFKEGVTNRASSEEYSVGGKGINVSRVLAELGVKSVAMGFTAGFTGEAIEKGLSQMNIGSDFIRLRQGNSRINVKIMTGTETEINGQGPLIDEEGFSALLGRIDRIGNGDTLVLAGSIPATLSDDAYERILKRIEWRDVRIVVDAGGRLLINCLSFKPFLIKPNLQELSELFGREMNDEREIERCAGELRRKGARNVIVSMGGNGAMLLAEDGRTYRCGVVDDRVINTVGAGDSMVAGFVAGFEQTGDYEYSLRLGAACGNATAVSTGLAKREKIAEILGRL